MKRNIATMLKAVLAMSAAAGFLLGGGAISTAGADDTAYYDGPISGLEANVVSLMAARGIKQNRRFVGDSQRGYEQRLGFYYKRDSESGKENGFGVALQIYLYQPKTDTAKERKGYQFHAFKQFRFMADDDRVHGRLSGFVENTLSEEYKKIIWPQGYSPTPPEPDWSKAPKDPLSGVYLIPAGQSLLSLTMDDGPPKIYAHLGNVVVSASVQKDRNAVVPVTAKEVVDAVFSHFRGKESASGGVVEVFPFAGLSPSNKGLIPASKKLPAKIRVKAGKPGVPVAFNLRKNTAGELSSGIVQSDKNGIAEAYFHYVPKANQSQKEVRKEIVDISFGGKTLVAEITIGLGVAFDKPKAVIGQTYENNTYALALGVVSTDNPELKLAQYVFNAEQSGAWGSYKLGLRLFTDWVNRPDGADHDEYFRGTVNITADSDKGSILTANQQPWYTPPGGKFFYPAVVMKSEGKHAYRIYGRLAVLTAGGGDFVDYVDEDMARGEGLVILSKETPEAWYQSLACSFDATDIVQYAMLETAKMMPVYGSAADVLTTATSLACKLVKGDYESAFYDLGTVLGGKYLDHLKEPAVYAKLTPKQQSALDLAKAAYDKLGDKAKEDQRNGLIKQAAQNAGFAQGDGKADIPADSASEKEQMRDSVARTPAPQLGAVPAQRSPSAPDNPADVKNAARDNMNEKIKNEAQKILKDVFKGIFK